MKTNHNCLWIYDESYCYYETDCNHSFQFSNYEETEPESEFRYCPYCGGNIVLQREEVYDG